MGNLINFELSSIRMDENQSEGTSIIVSVFKNITKRKKAEYELVQSAKLKAVGQLATGIAHEIRNPLTVLIGFVQILQSKQPELYDHFQIMREELTRINLIVSEFMALAKPHQYTYEPRT